MGRGGERSSYGGGGRGGDSEGRDSNGKIHPALLTSRIKGCRTPEQLGDLIEAHDFDYIHVVAALGSLTRMQQSPASQTLIKLTALVRTNMGRMKARELANTLHALAKLGHYDAPLVAALLVRAGEKLPDFKMQELCSTAWAVGKLKHLDTAFMAAVQRRAGEMLARDEVDAAGLCNLVWGAASIGHHDEAFTGALLRSAERQLRSFTPQVR